MAENLGRLGQRALVLDAALPARRHRQRLFSITREHDVPVIGVFVRVSPDLALSRNVLRSADKRVPQAALESVLSLLEPPSQDEGFVWVHEVEQQANLPAALQTARLRLVTPDVGLAERLADALNANYELHRDFLAWSKPHWLLEDTQNTLQRA